MPRGGGGRETLRRLSEGLLYSEELLVFCRIIIFRPGESLGTFLGWKISKTNRKKTAREAEDVPFLTLISDRRRGAI